MDRGADKKSAKIEIMYLLVLMRQLGKNYRIHESVLASSFGFEQDLQLRSTLSYFSIVTLLFI